MSDLPTSIVRDTRTRLDSDDMPVKEAIRSVLLLLESSAVKQQEIHADVTTTLSTTKEMKHEISELRHRLDSLESGRVAGLEKAKDDLMACNKELTERLETLESSFNFIFVRMPKLVLSILGAISLICGIVYGAVELSHKKNIDAGPPQTEMVKSR